MGLSIARIDIFSAAKPFLCVVELGSIEGNDAQIVKRAFMLRIEIEDGPVKRLRGG